MANKENALYSRWSRQLQVIKDNKIVQDDWQRLTELAEDQPIPAGQVIIPFDYWLAHREKLIEAGQRYAVCINGDHDTAEVARDLSHFEMIALDFPVFTDGRSYSHARLLRERYGYTGELRAVGDVLRDQLFYMQRCGIDSFQLRDDKDIEDALKAFKEFSITYQSAADGTQPIYKIR